MIAKIRFEVAAIFASQWGDSTEPRRLPPHTNIGDIAEKAKDIQEPQNHSDHYYRIQDPFDGTLHRYVAVNQPKQNANHDQNHHKLKQRHNTPHWILCLGAGRHGAAPGYALVNEL
jgi:hypothetical protein